MATRKTQPRKYVSPTVARQVQAMMRAKAKANAKKSPVTLWLETTTNVARDGQPPETEWAKNTPGWCDSSTIGVLGV